MSHNATILLLGSNLGDKFENINRAKTLIGRDVGLIEKESDIIETQAEGFTSNHLFLNQAIQVSTSFSPIELLNALKRIETEMGRTYTDPLPGEAYTDRNIDIDILIFNKLKFKSIRLEIPHQQIYTRKFVEKLISFY